MKWELYCRDSPKQCRQKIALMALALASTMCSSNTSLHYYTAKDSSGID